ncbi:MAG: hypothetical protein ACRD4K_04585 [Candidatus Acidiferrales bacterium]
MMRKFKILAVVLIAFVAGFCVSALLFRSMPVQAAPSPAQSSIGGCVSAVPQQWGQYKGGSAQSGLAFEDREGTIRFLTNIPCGATPPVALEIRRTAGSTGN